MPPRDVRKPACLHDQDTVAGRERVDECRLTGAGARRGVDHDGTARLEHRTQAVEDLVCKPPEVRAPMVDGWIIHRPEHPIRNIGWSWNLQKVASRACGHRSAPNAQYYRICNFGWQGC